MHHVISKPPVILNNAIRTLLGFAGPAKTAVDEEDVLKAIGEVTKEIDNVTRLIRMRKFRTWRGDERNDIGSAFGWHNRKSEEGRLRSN